MLASCLVDAIPEVPTNIRFRKMADCKRGKVLLFRVQKTILEQDANNEHVCWNLTNKSFEAYISLEKICSVLYNVFSINLSSDLSNTRTFSIKATYLQLSRNKIRTCYKKNKTRYSVYFSTHFVLVRIKIILPLPELLIKTVSVTCLSWRY